MASGWNVLNPHGYSHAMSDKPWKGLKRSENKRYRSEIDLRKLRWNCGISKFGNLLLKGLYFQYSIQTGCPIWSEGSMSKLDSLNTQSSICTLPTMTMWPVSRISRLNAYGRRSIFLFSQGASQAASVHLPPQMAANTPCQPWWKWRPWSGKGLLDKSWKCSVFRIHLFGYLFVFSSCSVFTIRKL